MDDSKWEGVEDPREPWDVVRDDARVLAREALETVRAHLTLFRQWAHLGWQLTDVMKEEMQATSAALARTEKQFSEPGG